MTLASMALLSLTIALAQASYADTLEFRCEWQRSDPPYVVDYSVNLASGLATRSDGASEWTVMQANDRAIWLASRGSASGSTLPVQIIERSPVGGVWTDIWLWAHGEAEPSVGGYCIERS